MSGTAISLVVNIFIIVIAVIGILGAVFRWRPLLLIVSAWQLKGNDSGCMLNFLFFSMRLFGLSSLSLVSLEQPLAFITVTMSAVRPLKATGMVGREPSRLITQAQVPRILLTPFRTP